MKIISSSRNGEAAQKLINVSLKKSSGKPYKSAEVTAKCSASNSPCQVDNNRTSGVYLYKKHATQVVATDARRKPENFVNCVFPKRGSFFRPGVVGEASEVNRRARTRAGALDIEKRALKKFTGRSESQPEKQTCSNTALAENGGRVRLSAAHGPAHSTKGSQGDTTKLTVVIGGNTIPATQG